MRIGGWILRHFGRNIVIACTLLARVLPCTTGSVSPAAVADTRKITYKPRARISNLPANPRERVLSLSLSLSPSEVKRTRANEDARLERTKRKTRIVERGGDVERGRYDGENGDCGNV